MSDRSMKNLNNIDNTNILHNSSLLLWLKPNGNQKQQIFTDKKIFKKIENRTIDFQANGTKDS